MEEKHGRREACDNETGWKQSESGSAGEGFRNFGKICHWKLLSVLQYLCWNALIGSILQKKLHNL